MVLKTFNVSEDTYNKFSHKCKQFGISMSKQVDLFIQSQVEEKPKAKREYLERLEIIRKGKFMRVKSFAEQYGL